MFLVVALKDVDRRDVRPYPGGLMPDAERASAMSLPGQ